MRGSHRSGLYGDGDRYDSCRPVGQVAGACLLSDESRGEDRAGSVAAFVFAFVIRQHAESGCEPEQFVVREAKVPSSGMVMAHVVVDGEGL